MKALLLLVLLLATARSAEPPLAATPLRWEAGRVTLAAAVARLSVAGNRAWLAEGIDDSVEAALPALDGSWWDGVIALCQAFALRPDAGEPADEHLEKPGVPVPIGHGTVVLSRGQLPGMQAVGGLLACVEAEAMVRLWLRAEPRVARGQLAWAVAEQATLHPPGNVRLEPFDQGERTDGLPPAATWKPSAPLPAAAQLRLAISAAGAGRWDARCTVTIGQTARMQVNGEEMLATLVVDPAQTTWEGRALPERRPLFAVFGPSALLARFQAELRQGEQEVPTRGSGARNEANEQQLAYRFLRTAPEGAVEVALTGRYHETPTRSELDLPLPKPEPGSAGSPIEAPAPLSWDAGERPLSQWLAALAATGNPVLPEVGVDTTAAVKLGALRGGFWDGVLALSAATGLAPAASGTPGLSGGAVRLVRRQPLAAVTCGPLLLDAERVPARPGEFAVRLHATIEPRLPEDGFAAPEFRWASWASDHQGRMHAVLSLDTTTSSEDHLVAQGNVLVRRNTKQNGQPAVDPVVVVRLQAAKAHQLTLHGLITLPRVQLWRATADLAVNEPCEVLLGAHAVELTALTAPTRIGSNQWGPGLLLRGLHGAADVHFALTTADGQNLEHPSGATRMNPNLPVSPWMGWCRIPGPGRLTAEVVARAALPPLVLPVQLTIPLPDGL